MKKLKLLVDCSHCAGLGETYSWDESGRHARSCPACGGTGKEWITVTCYDYREEVDIDEKAIEEFLKTKGFLYGRQKNEKKDEVER